LDQVLPVIGSAYHLSTEEVVERTGLSHARASQSLVALSYAGRVMYDLEARRWRHRELFSPPIDVARFYPPDLRREEAQALIDRGIANLVAVAEEDRKVRRYFDPITGEKREKELVFRQWRIQADCGGEHPTIVVNAEERIIFGQCGCAFYKDHLMARGPCPHMLALFHLSASSRTELVA